MMVILLAQAAWGLGDVAPLALIAFAVGAAVGFERTRRSAHRPTGHRRRLRERIRRS